MLVSGARRISGPRIVWPGARWKHFFARPVSATSIGQVYAHLHEAVRTVPHPAGLKSRPAQWLSFGRGARESLLKILAHVQVPPTICDLHLSPLSATLHLCKFQSQIPNSQTIGGFPRNITSCCGATRSDNLRSAVLVTCSTRPSIQGWKVWQKQHFRTSAQRRLTL